MFCTHRHSPTKREKERRRDQRELKMNSSSKVIMAATMVMVVSLVMVLSLVLVLLAELYCSLLLGRRRRQSLTLPTTSVVAAAATTTSLAQTISITDDPSPSNIDSSSPNPLTTGVLQTPKTFFKTKTHFRHESSLPSSPRLIREIQVPVDNDPLDNFIYISNPMYSNETASKPTTPFETPESSPSRLETGDSSSSCSSGEEDSDIIEDSTPTLTPMKDLPEKACSVSLKDMKSLETSPSESNGNNNNNNGESSSSSGSPSYTSPSW